MNVLISGLTFITVMLISLSLPYFIVKIYAIKHNTSYDTLMNSDYGPYGQYIIGFECDDVFLKTFFINVFILGMAMLFTYTSLDSNLIAIRLVSILLVVIGDFITIVDLIVALRSVVTPNKNELKIKF